MQRAQDGSTELVPEPPSPRPGLSPAIAFALLAIVVAVIAAAVFLTRPETELQAAATKPTSTSPNFALTNEEAIARLSELSKLRRKAFATNDATLLPLVYTPSGPAGSLAAKEIRTLQRNSVTDRSRFRTESTSVVSMTPDEIEIREVFVVVPRFVAAGGEDVTARRAPVRRTVDWTLRLDSTEWLIHDAVIVNSEVLR